MTLNDFAFDLNAAAIGTSTVDLFVSYFPKEPSNVISLHNQVNARPVRAMAKTTDHEVNIIQTIVRNVDHDSGYNLIRSIYLRWDKFSGLMNGTRYLSILAQHDPSSLGQDENKRFRWTCSFEARRAV